MALIRHLDEGDMKKRKNILPTIDVSDINVSTK